MSNHDKWMPLYIGDYMGDTMHLSTLQHGAYMLLLMHYWRNGPLPNDDRKLAQIARTEDRAWRSIGPVIREFFSVNGDGTLHQKRMDWELRRWTEISGKRSDAGKLGGAGKHRSRPTADRPVTERVRRPFDSQTKEQNAQLRAQRLAEARVRGSHTEEEWQALLQVCGHRCLKCGGANPGKDHIVSLYLGGSDAIENLQPLCGSCNSRKGPDATDLRPDGWRQTQPNRVPAYVMPQPVDNLANDKQILSKPEAIAKQMLPDCLDFASVPLPPQRDNSSLSVQEKCARESLGTDREQNLVQPVDHLKLLLAESLKLAGETHKASLMSPERNHTPDVQKRAVAKPRSMACHLNGEHLVLARKQAAIRVAP
jgi:uncharacterized protein YdaU (DUF1376 family)